MTENKKGGPPPDRFWIDEEYVLGAAMPFPLDYQPNGMTVFYTEPNNASSVDFDAMLRTIRTLYKRYGERDGGILRRLVVTPKLERLLEPLRSNEVFPFTTPEGLTTLESIYGVPVQRVNFLDELHLPDVHEAYLVKPITHMGELVGLMILEGV